MRYSSQEGLALSFARRISRYVQEDLCCDCGASRHCFERFAVALWPMQRLEEWSSLRRTLALQ
jgi:hypothetical protein